MKDVLHKSKVEMMITAVRIPVISLYFRHFFGYAVRIIKLCHTSCTVEKYRFVPLLRQSVCDFLYPKGHREIPSFRRMK